MAVVDGAEGELAARYRSATSESRPAYQRVKDLVKLQIASGEWLPGHQLPSENQFVSMLGLSRMTINRALRELSTEKAIDRVMGVGTYVAQTKSSSPLFEVRNIADEIAYRGHRHSTKVVFVRREDNSGAATFAGVRDRFHSVLVHYEDSEPIQLEDRLVNPLLAPDYGAQDFTAVTPNEYLNRVAPLTRGEHIVEAVLPTDDESALLEIAPTEPCLLIRRRTWSGADLVSVARILHPGSRNRLEGTFEDSPAHY